MAIIVFPDNITINLPPSIAPSLSQTLLEITSLQSLLALLLSPFLAIFSYLYHTILLLIRITFFALRTKLILPIVWSMDSDILEEMLMPITIGGPIFWIACAFILVFLVHTLFRAILNSLSWLLDPYISDPGRHAHEFQLRTRVLCVLGQAKTFPSHEEKPITTKPTPTHAQPLARMIPRFQHLPRILLPRLVWTEAFSHAGQKDAPTPHHRDPDNADIVNRDAAGLKVASEDDTLTSNTTNGTATATATTPTTSSSKDIWGDLETY